MEGATIVKKVAARHEIASERLPDRHSGSHSSSVAATIPSTTASERASDIQVSYSAEAAAGRATWMVSSGLF